MQDQQPLKIFVVYAREDDDALKELRVQLIPVARSERLEVWYDGEILPGQHWDKEIKTQLQSADIILLFISKHFFASEYIQTTELKEALERHEEGKSVVVPVIVRHCVWQDDFEVSKFQALPTGAQPIFSSHWRDHDEAMVSVVEGVKKVARKLRGERSEQERLELIEKQKLEAQKAEKELKERLEKERLEAEKVALEQRERNDHKAFNLARAREDFEGYLKKGFTLHLDEARAKIDDFKKQEQVDADRARREQERKAEEKRLSDVETARLVREHEENERRAAEARLVEKNMTSLTNQNSPDRSYFYFFIGAVPQTLLSLFLIWSVATKFINESTHQYIYFGAFPLQFLFLWYYFNVIPNPEERVLIWSTYIFLVNLLVCTVCLSVTCTPGRT